MKLPGNQEIVALHQKYATTKKVFDLNFTHSQIVWEIADQLIKKSNVKVDTELVKVGCLLHDIGVYHLFDDKGKLRNDINYITHGIEGEEILKSEGLPELIWRFASHHTGVGLTKLDVINHNLPLGVNDYLAETTEESLVMYADKFHSKTEPPYFNSYQWYKKDVAKFGNDKVAKFDKMAKQFGLPDLRPLIKKYKFELR